MVIYNHTAQQDLIEILYGLITWGKHELSVQFCEQYVDDIIDVIDEICKKSNHRNTTFETHTLFGDKVFTYKKNQHTVWYFIYNWDSINRIAYLNKILNNHITNA